jgi:hypothetical protein
MRIHTFIYTLPDEARSASTQSWWPRFDLTFCEGLLVQGLMYYPLAVVRRLRCGRWAGDTSHNRGTTRGASSMLPPGEKPTWSSWRRTCTPPQFMGSPTRNLAINIQFVVPRLIESTVSDHAGRRKHLLGYNRASILRGMCDVRRIFPWQRHMEGQRDRRREQQLSVSTSCLGRCLCVHGWQTSYCPTACHHRPQQLRGSGRSSFSASPPRAGTEQD